jgi:NADH-quinone oxidoreductase subunit E
VKPMAKTAAPKPKAAPKVVPVAAEPAVVAEKAPDLLPTPRATGADDLKKIVGIGPKLEGVLNGLGFWHFDQVAAWGAAEIAWVDARIAFKGRIIREDWVAQARTLAKS